MTTVILLNPLGSDVTQFVNGDPLVPQLLDGTIMAPGDTLYTLPYTNEAGASNIAAGVSLLDTKLKATSGHKRVVGYSEGCQVATKWLRDHGADGVTDLEFLMIADSENKYGGFIYGHSIFNSISDTAGLPGTVNYPVTYLIRQYDGWSDFPVSDALNADIDALSGIGSGNDAAANAMRAAAAAAASDQNVLTAVSNAIAGMSLVHTLYLDVTVADAANVTYTDPAQPTVEYVWSPTYPVPLLGIGDTFPQTDQQLRTQIESAYTRPVTIPLPNYADNTGYGTEPFPVAAPAAPVTGWWAK